MVVVAGLFAALSMLAAGVVALYEQRLYTDDQRAQVRRLFQMRGLLWLLTLGISLGGFAGALTGHLGTTFGSGLYYVLIGLSLSLCYVERRLQQALGLDRTLLGQRFDEWWRHPSEE